MSRVWVLASLALLTFGCSTTSNEIIPPAPPRAAELPNGLASFHEWHRVNDRPHYVYGELDLLCRNVTLQEQFEQAKNPHVHKFAIVYANAKAKPFMNGSRPFPEGSVIVKEKIAREAVGPPRKPVQPILAGARPEVSTVMIKREKGFNAKCGDWEFAVLDAEGKKLLERGKIERCMSCHVEQKNTDFLFKTYMQASLSLKREGATLPGVPAVVE